MGGLEVGVGRCRRLLSKQRGGELVEVSCPRVRLGFEDLVEVLVNGLIVVHDENAMIGGTVE
jgi:hypothetical protein